MEKYKTHDLWFVASLLTYGILYESIDETNPNKKLFVFKKDYQFETANAEYYSGRLNVPALQFAANYKQLLNLVKNERQ